MKKFALCVAVLSVFAISNMASAVDVILQENGKIALGGSGEQIVGADFRSAGGNLVPGPAGEAAPFGFVLANTANQIAYGSLGTKVTLDGVVETKAGYSGAADVYLGADFSADLGDASLTVAKVAVPEPASALLAGFGSLALLAFRRRS